MTEIDARIDYCWQQAEQEGLVDYHPKNEYLN